MRRFSNQGGGVHRRLTLNQRIVLAATPLAVLAACGGDSSKAPTAPPAPPPAVVTVTVYNRLDLPVTVASGATTYGSLGSNQSTFLTLPPRTASLEWTSTRRRFSDGSAVPDDLGGASVNIGTNLNTIDITNVVSGVTYFTPTIRKDWPDTISIELVAASGARCLGAQWGPTFSSATWGYYRFDATTELRYYRGMRCGVGNYRGWNNATLLSSMAIGSGFVSLRADLLPLP
jgi:hypothetical protein